MKWSFYFCFNGHFILRDWWCLFCGGNPRREPSSWRRSPIGLGQPSSGGLQLALEQFTAECEASGMRRPGLRNKLSLELLQYTKLLCLNAKQICCLSYRLHLWLNNKYILYLLMLLAVQSYGKPKFSFRIIISETLFYCKVIQV